MVASRDQELQKPNASEIDIDVPVPHSNDGGKREWLDADVVPASPARQGTRSGRAALAAAPIKHQRTLWKGRCQPLHRSKIQWPDPNEETES